MFNCYIHGWSNIGKTELDNLKAENARLREALESISGIYNDEDEPSKGYAGNIAREALKGVE
jgi:hypothetical protein